MNYLDVIDQFSEKKILVIGDFILDVYVRGMSTRLSPEAPVPVVDVNEKTKLLGGAANTACNLKALSADVTFCSVLGTDDAADQAIQLLRASSIRVTHILKHAERSTLVKTRVMAGDRILIRYDEGNEHPLSDTIEQAVVKLLQEEYVQYDAIVISDYNKGVITENLVSALKELQDRHRKFLVIDSKRLPFFSSLKPTLVKPNYREVLDLLEIPDDYSGRIDQVQGFSKQIVEKTQATFIAVTLDNEGSLIFHGDELVCQVMAPSVVSANVSGAGDTYISAFTLGYLCAEQIDAAAELATAAAYIAVNKSQTAACFKKELKCYFSRQQKCIHSLINLEDICQDYRAQGKKIVFTNGCFDILHSGHVSYLNQARALGDILIVGVNDDGSIRRLKGDGRPINPLEDRLQVLAALTAVTHVVPFGDQHDDTPIKLINAVRPSVFVKGGDYTRDKLPEAETVDEVGGKIIFIPHVPDHSTTHIIHRITTPSYKRQTALT